MFWIVDIEDTQHCLKLNPQRSLRMHRKTVDQMHMDIVQSDLVSRLICLNIEQLHYLKSTKHLL